MTRPRGVLRAFVSASWTTRWRRLHRQAACGLAVLVPTKPARAVAASRSTSARVPGAVAGLVVLAEQPEDPVQVVECGSRRVEHHVEGGTGGRPARGLGLGASACSSMRVTPCPTTSCISRAMPASLRGAAPPPGPALRAPRACAVVASRSARTARSSRSRASRAKTQITIGIAVLPISSS